MRNELYTVVSGRIVAGGKHDCPCSPVMFDGKSYGRGGRWAVTEIDFNLFLQEDGGSQGGKFLREEAIVETDHHSVYLLLLLS